MYDVDLVLIYFKNKSVCLGNFHFPHQSYILTQQQWVVVRSLPPV